MNNFAVKKALLNHEVSTKMFPPCFPKNERPSVIFAKPLILWCPHTDSNRGPTDYKSVALPAEL